MKLWYSYYFILFDFIVLNWLIKFNWANLVKLCSTFVIYIIVPTLTKLSAQLFSPWLSTDGSSQDISSAASIEDQINADRTEVCLVRANNVNSEHRKST